MGEMMGNNNNILMVYPQTYEWEETGRFIEEAFNKSSHENKMWLDKVLSRKKQVVPFLENIFRN